MRLTRLWLAIDILAGVPTALMVTAGVLFAPLANACDAGNWYDPTHQVCAPYPPAYPPNNYTPPSNYPYPPDQWPGNYR